MPIENIALFFRGLLTDRGPFKAALNAFVAEERALENPWGQRGAASLQNGLYPHRGQADRGLIEDPGSNLLLPLPG
jgi:hypothetical protein